MSVRSVSALAVWCLSLDGIFVPLLVDPSSLSFSRTSRYPHVARPLLAWSLDGHGVVPFSVIIMNEVLVNVHKQGFLSAYAFLLPHTQVSSSVPPGGFTECWEVSFYLGVLLRSAKLHS